jgi:hypothetical protein
MCITYSIRGNYTHNLCIKNLLKKYKNEKKEACAGQATARRTGFATVAVVFPLSSYPIPFAVCAKKQATRSAATAAATAGPRDEGGSDSDG